jgi:hypothetical protein
LKPPEKNLICLVPLERGIVRQVKKNLFDEKKLATMTFDILVKNYLKEAKKPSARSRSPEASIRSSELLEIINTFSEALFKIQRSKGQNHSSLGGAISAESQVPEALDNLFNRQALPFGA